MQKKLYNNKQAYNTEHFYIHVVWKGIKNAQIAQIRVVQIGKVQFLSVNF